MTSILFIRQGDQDSLLDSSGLRLLQQLEELVDGKQTFELVPSENIKTGGGFAELIYLPKGDDSKWYLAGLYNWLDSDLDELDYSSATVHYGRMLRRNIRATAEFTYVFDSNTF